MQFGSIGGIKRYLNNLGFSPGGDLAGTATEQIVAGLQGHPLAPDIPMPGDAIMWNGSTYAPSTIPHEPSIYNVKTYGAKGDGVSNDSPAIQTAMDTLTANWRTGTSWARLYFPPGVYRLYEPVEFNGDTYAFLKLEIVGSGKSNTILHQKYYSTKDLLHFNNVGTAYIACLTIRDLQFGPCVQALKIDNFTYSNVIDCSFKSNGWDKAHNSVMLTGNTSGVFFKGCWWYHQRGNNLRVENGGVTMAECLFGEDSGAIWVRGGVNFIGCAWGGRNYDRINSTGYMNMGRASVIVEGGSNMLCMGCTLGTIKDVFCTADMPSALNIIGCSAALYGGTLIKTRRIFGNHSVCLANNHYIWAREGECALWTTADGYPINNSHCVGNTLRVSDSDNASMTVDDSLLDPANRNVVENNIIRSL